MTVGLHLAADIPESASKDERRNIIAAGVDAAVRHAAASPDFRLEMILGEAWADFATIVADTVAKLRKDEQKAPGLLTFAERNAPASIDAGNAHIVKAVILRSALNRIKECRKITVRAIPGID